jgi:sugar lactone lactonase YvrE
VLYKPHVTADLRDQLEEDFVKTSEGVFNWWFPEFTGGSNPNNPGQPPARGYKSLGTEGVWAVLSWPFQPSHWSTLTKYMLYRELPLELDGRNMEVFVRRDLAPGGGAGQAAQVPTETVVAETLLVEGQLNNPRGMARDNQGNLYIADAGNHRIVVLGPDGTQVRTIGSIGNGDGQLNEPSGVSVDDDGNVYVADTWNGRVVKFDGEGTFLKSWGKGEVAFGDPFVDQPSGQSVQRFATDTKGDPEANTAKPLGFFGPRNVLVRGDRVYISDTGNSRVVVTDREGTFIQQFGNKGQSAGQLQEPIGLGTDDQGQLYVGDTWNGRIQVFQTADDGNVNPIPLTAFDVKGWASNTYNDPYIAVAGDGRVWAAQGGRNTIGEFNAAHQYIRRLKTEPDLKVAKGLVVGSNNELFVVNSGVREVLRLPLP